MLLYQDARYLLQWRTLLLGTGQKSHERPLSSRESLRKATLPCKVRLSLLSYPASPPIIAEYYSVPFASFPLRRTPIVGFRKRILASADKLLLIQRDRTQGLGAEIIDIAIVHLKYLPIWVPLPGKCIASALMSASLQHSECRKSVNQSLTKDRWHKYRFGSNKHHGKSGRDTSEDRSYSHQKDPNDL
jgi:hypothetical protein